MNAELQKEYQMSRDVHDTIKEKGWEFLMERLYLLAKYGYEHGALTDALSATLEFAKDCDRQTRESGIFPPKKKLMVRVRRRKK